MSIGIEILIVAFLVILNGFFAMSELAVVSSRKPRLNAMAEAGSRGARRALALAEDPGAFLSTVQIGITLVGVLAGAYSGATLAEPFAVYLAQFPWLAEFAEGAAVAIVVAGITYASLIVGELVPKQIALKNPERVASVVALPMMGLAKLMAPIVWFLGVSSRVLLWLLRAHRPSAQRVTEAEVKAVIEEGAEAGVLHPQERDMLAGVMRLADRRVGVMVTPRPDIVWLDVEDTVEINTRKILQSGYSRFPVAAGDLDRMLGVVLAKDLLDACLQGRPVELRDLARPAPVIQDRASGLTVLQHLRSTSLELAVVVDDYGSFIGIITAADILGAITGYMGQPMAEEEEGHAQQREDGSWLLDGGMPVDEVKELLELKELHGEKEFYTLAGCLLHQFGDLPKPGQSVLWSGYTFEVMDMDGNRIDKVLATQIAPHMSEIEL